MITMLYTSSNVCVTSIIHHAPICHILNTRSICLAVRSFALFGNSYNIPIFCNICTCAFSYHFLTALAIPACHLLKHQLPSLLVLQLPKPWLPRSQLPTPWRPLPQRMTAHYWATTWPSIAVVMAAPAGCGSGRHSSWPGAKGASSHGFPALLTMVASSGSMTAAGATPCQ